MKKVNLGIIIGAAIFPAVLAVATDFKEAKQKLSSADCTHFDFLSIVESKVFDLVDTASGSAYIARDGRYIIKVGPDVYLFDGDSLYTYFWENNQVIIEKPDNADLVASEISFVMKLDEWYDSKALRRKNTYRLTKKRIDGDIPDSMIVTLHAKGAEIEMIEYFDINGDLNRIIIQDQNSDTVCNKLRFVPEFPDTVEKVRL